MEKLLIACPASKYIEAETFTSIYNLSIPDGIETEFAAFVGYSVDIARNHIVNYAKNNGYAYIFWVDADVILPRDALVRLMTRKKEIISGVYPQKDLKNNKACVLRDAGDEKKSTWDADELLQSGELVEAAAFGFGCCLTKTEVFDAVDYPWFVFTDSEGEDVYFCDQARKKGLSLWCDTTVLCGHKGEICYQIRRTKE